MSKLRDPFTLHCQELLAPLGTVRLRAMFGGVGFYVDDLFIALIAEGRFFLKAGPQHMAAFEAAGCAPFVYETKDGDRMTMGYREAPEEALESPAAMQPWARRALEAALVAANAKPAARKKPAAKTRRTA
jgi:DNA transformation protein and related proteins